MFSRVEKVADLKSDHKNYVLHHFGRRNGQKWSNAKNGNI